MNNITKVCIICPEHGEFWQRPNAHLRGDGCPKCGGSGKLNTNEFIKRSREIHGDKYDYSKINYVNSQTKVCIICPKHGEFWQTPSHHLKGIGCPKCGIESVQKSHISTAEEFINKAREVHGNKYDYSKINYVNSRTKVCIICPEHGEFWQKPNDHLMGKGCPKCSGNGKLNTNEFIKKARAVHGDKYDYSKVEYVNTNTKVCIICPKHGEFWQTPSGHLSGKGCHKCYKESRSSTTEEFINKAREIHGNKYDYSKVNYVNAYTKVCIICPEHGEFWQIPAVHLNGHGCPNCQGATKQYKFNLLQEFESKYELRAFLENNDVNILYVILQNINPKFEPIKDDIEKALKNVSLKDPIKALEEKYAKDEDETSTNSKDDDGSTTIETTNANLDDYVVNEDMYADEIEKDKSTNNGLTIEDIVKNTEKEIKAISKIYPMLSPKVREYIKNKYLNDKLRVWMANREASK